MRRPVESGRAGTLRIPFAQKGRCVNALLKLCVAGSVIAGTSLASGGAGGPPRPLIEYRNPATYQINHRITFTNHDVTTMNSLELNLPVPTDWAGLIYVCIFKFS